MNLIDNYPTNRVPTNIRLSFLSVTLVHAGMLTALDQFMLGAVLGNSMTLAIFISSIIFGIITFGLGFAGMKEGLSSSLLARWCGFGRIGSILVSLTIAISLIGWFGVQNAVFAKGLNYALGHKLGFEWSATLSGIFLTILVAFGFKALRFTAWIAVPFFVIVILFISAGILEHHNSMDLIQSVPGGETITLSSAITLIMGGCIVATLITPDMSRYSKNSRQVFWMVMVSIILGEFVINGLAILLARALNTADVVTIMTQAAGGIGLLVVIFSTLRVNDINLYSSSLSIVNSISVLTGKKVNYTIITLAIGIIGTTLSVLGILDRFVGFLTILGVVFPPIIVGVMLTDYFIIKTHRNILQETQQLEKIPANKDTPLIGWNAVCACIIASIIGITVEVGIPTINSLLAACIIYGLLSKIKR
ncbi:cytosine permease [Arsenophonus sp.]|uniref:cytosine permease n=1 Tax=Arsenophonus sp. TaxID=1872640 RepID=UPI00285E5FAF|nr:cytosine permease [Arsenophonus sp.]MDR5617043.1 cytosine permease [Arsenophonus sp.]